MLAAELACEVAEIMDFELTLCDTQPSQIWGLERELLSAPRLDNQMHCFTALRALLDHAARAPASAPDVCLVALFDHEEVGSDSSTGAGGPIMGEAMARVASCFSDDTPHAAAEALHASTRRSFLMSADSAHAVHPNYASRHEAAHAPQLNKGTVIKTNDNQRYATNGDTGFVVRELARIAGVGVQEFMVKNDCPCGSTIGPLISSKTVRDAAALSATRALALESTRRRAPLERRRAGAAHRRPGRGVLVDALDPRDRRRRRRGQLLHSLPHLLLVVCRARQEVLVPHPRGLPAVPSVALRERPPLLLISSPRRLARVLYSRGAI